MALVMVLAILKAVAICARFRANRAARSTTPASTRRLIDRPTALRLMPQPSAIVA